MADKQIVIKTAKGAGLYMAAIQVVTTNLIIPVQFDIVTGEAPVDVPTDVSLRLTLTLVGAFGAIPLDITSGVTKLIRSRQSKNPHGLPKTFIVDFSVGA